LAAVGAVLEKTLTNPFAFAAEGFFAYTEAVPLEMNLSVGFAANTSG
jgi:hypothetical protein